VIIFISMKFILALVEDDEDRPSLQQRPTNANTPTTQAMRIILEEDENPDSPPAE
jgi:hypothetical protein